MVLQRTGPWHRQKIKIQVKGTSPPPLLKKSRQKQKATKNYFVRLTALTGVKSTLPPPIFVKGVICFTDLCSELIELIGVDNFSCKSSANHLKIMTTNPASYRTLIHFLKKQKAEYHTYQLKEDNPMRVVIRNLHPSTSTELFKSELELRLFEVRQVTSVLHKIDKHPLPLFFVDFEPTSQSNDIHKLKSLIHTKIKVEEPYKLKTISQCINCQDYGHTKSYCGYPARYVRCGALHSSSACTNPRDATPKCALCSGDHPSNYKGCSVYKEQQLRNKPKMSSPLLGNLSHKKSVQVSQPVVTPLAHSSDSSQTYAQATSGTHPNNIIPPPVSDINK
ncbi:Pre-C2HC domain [Cinara cedri]|uniref:Pre-C2HC domain n=1 Tax=Cinara cedri TaxID=506608 RepID=A0A5E4M3Y7_9HEMI|nr:Pre-C2HC domain [Cinara cedri]